MQASTKRALVVVLIVVLLALIGAWWFSDFSLDFSRFFAYEGVTCAEASFLYPSDVCSAATGSCRRHQEFQGTRIVDRGGNYSYCYECPAGALDVCKAGQPATPAPPAGAVGCAPATQTVAVGAVATLTGSGGQANFTWVAPGGSPSTGTGATFSVTYASAGAKKVIVGGPRQTQETDTNRVPHDSVACTVVVTP